MPIFVLVNEWTGRQLTIMISVKTTILICSHVTADGLKLRPLDRFCWSLVYSIRIESLMEIILHTWFLSCEQKNCVCTSNDVMRWG